MPNPCTKETLKIPRNSTSKLVLQSRDYNSIINNIIKLMQITSKLIYTIIGKNTLNPNIIVHNHYQKKRKLIFKHKLENKTYKNQVTCIIGRL